MTDTVYQRTPTNHRSTRRLVTALFWLLCVDLTSLHPTAVSVHSTTPAIWQTAIYLDTTEQPIYRSVYLLPEDAYSRECIEVNRRR